MNIATYPNSPSLTKAVMGGIPIPNAAINTAPPIDERTVPAAFRRLGNETERYRALLEQLEKRLSPVVRRLPIEPGEQCEKNPSTGCELSDAVEGQNVFIASNNNRLQDIIDRIEV